jgi:hypothetical protein
MRKAQQVRQRYEETVSISCEARCEDGSTDLRHVRRSMEKRGRKKASLFGILNERLPQMAERSTRGVTAP